MTRFGEQPDPFILDGDAVEAAAASMQCATDLPRFASPMDRAHMAGLEEVERQLEAAGLPFVMTSDMSRVLSTATRNALREHGEIVD